MSDVTKDSLFNDRIMIAQPASGYRFSIDAVLLANAAAFIDAGRVCDIGTGCGIIPLVMAYRNPDISGIYGIEIQKHLAEIATGNVVQNRMADRITIVCKDVKNMGADDIKGPVDLIVCNPPHYEQSAARVNPRSEKALARHEITLRLPDLLSAAARLLTAGGRLMMIYPASRTPEVLSRMRHQQIAPKWLRFVHTAPGKEAKRVIVAGVFGGGAGATIADPLFLCDKKGRYTPEVSAMFAE
ncbi:MAG: tRNA1(Val) (adenine(37)-N6)-methyltransferase [Thermodesulfobacteriota bacterium]